MTEKAKIDLDVELAPVRKLNEELRKADDRLRKIKDKAKGLTGSINKMVDIGSNPAIGDAYLATNRAALADKNAAFFERREYIRRERAERDSQRRRDKAESQRLHEINSVRARASAGARVGGMMALGGVTAAAGGAFYGSPGAVVGGWGGAIAGTIKGVYNTAIRGLAGVEKVAEKFRKGLGKLIPGIGDTLAGIVGAGTAGLAVAAQARYGLATQRAQVTGALREWESVGGTREIDRASATAIGLGPAAAAAQMSAYGRAAGYRGSAMDSSALFSFMRRGLGASDVGAFMGVKASGVGATEAGLNRIVNTGNARSMFGAQLSSYLGIITSAISAGAQQGVRSGLGDGRFVARVAATLGAGGGMDAARFAAATTSMPASARQQFLAPFQNLAQPLLLADAARRGRGGGLAGIVRGFEQQAADPQGVLSALNLGGLGPLIMASMGTMDNAEKLFGPLAAGRTRPGIGKSLAETSAGAAAGAEFDQLGTMSEKTAIGLVRAMGSLTTAINRMAAKQSVDSGVAGIVQTTEKAVDWADRAMDFFGVFKRDDPPGMP